MIIECIEMKVSSDQSVRGTGWDQIRFLHENLTAAGFSAVLAAWQHAGWGGCPRAGPRPRRSYHLPLMHDIITRTLMHFYI